MSKEIVYLKTESLRPHPQNPRLNLGDLTELSGSIRQRGIMQNLTVVPAEDGMYTVIIGHRRLAAAKLAGLEEVPCIIAEMSPEDQFRTMMIENMQRADLTNLEQADGFQMMLDFGDSKASISEQTGFSRSTIDRRLKLREFDRKKIEAAEMRGGTIFDYMKIAEIKDEDARNKLLDVVGTPDFQNQLKTEQNIQIKAEDSARIMEVVKIFAKELKNSNDRWNSKYERIANYKLGAEPPCDVKIPEGKGPFFYWETSWDIEIYAPAKKQAKEKKNKKQLELEHWQREQKGILKDIAQRHKQLRDDFIERMTEGKLNQDKRYMAVIEMAARCFSPISTFDFDRHFDRERIEKAFGIEWKNDSYWAASAEEKDAAELKTLEAPVRLLFLEIITGIESNGSEFWFEKYPSGFETDKRKIKKLKAYYGFLERLGYEISEEERQSMDGTIINRIMETYPDKK